MLLFGRERIPVTFGLPSEQPPICPIVIFLVDHGRMVARQPVCIVRQRRETSLHGPEFPGLLGTIGVLAQFSVFGGFGAILLRAEHDRAFWPLIAWPMPCPLI